MNKKVSTLLTVAMVLGGSLLSTSAFADSKPVNIDQAVKDGKYYSLKMSYKYVNKVWSPVEELGFVVPAEGGVFVRNTAVEASELGDNVWKVTKVTAAGVSEYTFVNKQGVKFAISEDAGFTVRDAKIGGTESFSLNKEGVGAGTDTKYVVLDGNQFAVSTDAKTLAAGFLLESYSEDVISAKELNSIQGGDGLVFAYPTEEQPEVKGDILTGKQLLAVEVKANNSAAKTEKIPAGIYFVVKASESLKLEKDGTLKNDAEQVKAFLASEFIAVNPTIPSSTSNWDVANGVGFALTTVVGENLSTEDKTKGETVAIQNACFAVAEPDVYNTTNQYTLSVKAALETEKGKEHKEKSVALAVKKAQGSSYLVTTTGNDEEVVRFKTQASETSALIDATTLLNADKTPAIYAIKVLSGDAKGQILTNGKYSMPGVDVNDPTNQYVISNVDKKTNVVTFKSRVNGDKLTVSFYGDAVGLTYKVVATGNNAKIKYAKSENDTQISFVETNLNAETVELVKVTPKSKFDSFVNRDKNDNSLVSFRVAPNADTDRYLNINVPTDQDGNVTVGQMLYDADNAAQFMLVNKKYDKTAKYNTVNEFAYLKGEEIATAKTDTVAYPTYQIKAYEVDNFDQPTKGKFIGGGYELKDGNTDALDFIVKENADGSVYLISEASGNYYVATWQGMTVDAKVGNEATPYTTAYYATILNRANKVYMSGDEASVSLEAKSQHVSMQETVAGGYMMAADNNDAIIKGAEGAAVLWLDTTMTEAAIPTFYISQGGKFLYNATDSTSNKLDGDNYKVPGTNNAKLIFKKAELIGSDTLKTTVNDKDVMVAEKANALQNVVAGIKNFQYQILKAEEAEQYVIRQNNNMYIKAINGYLTLTNQPKEAMHVVVTSESAPTSNEDVVVTSEVKVVANNGSVVVKNAAGKNVVVSTILGQVVANEVLTSDNATINVPAGIVVVSVDGESFKVNVR